MALVSHRPAPIETVQRPEPPVDLSEEMATEWRVIVNALPADYFRPETLAVLAQYCRHVVAAKRVGQLIAALEKDSEFDVSAYQRALSMQANESRILAILGSKMRLNQSATSDPHTHHKPKLGAKPWED